MARLLGLGENFPDFSLQACVSAEPGSEFRIVDSRDLEGTWTAIFFWPRDFTFVCPTELVEFNRALREFRALAAKVLGVSGDSHHTHLAWRQEKTRPFAISRSRCWRTPARNSPKSSASWTRSSRFRFGRPT